MLKMHFARKFSCKYFAIKNISIIEDSATYDNLDKKWGVDVKILSDKINALSSSAVEAIYRRVENCWKNCPLTLEEWAKY